MAAETNKETDKVVAARQLLAELEADGFDVRAVGGKLLVTPASRLGSALVERIRGLKADLLAELVWRQRTPLDVAVACGWTPFGDTGSGPWVILWWPDEDGAPEFALAVSEQQLALWDQQTAARQSCRGRQEEKRERQRERSARLTRQSAPTIFGPPPLRPNADG